MKKETVVRDEFIRKRIERQKRIRKRRLTVFFIFFIVMLISVAVTLSLTVFFPIEKITVKGSNIYGSEEIIKYSGIEKGENLFMVSRADAEKALKKTLPYVESIEIEREFPDTLSLTVKDATEFACYNVKGRFYIVSSSGWVLKETAEKPENLTEIITDTVGCKVGSEIVFSADTNKELIDEITREFEAVKLKVNSINVKEKISIYVNVEDRFEVFLGTPNNIKEKIRHLGGMIKEIPKNKKGEINLSMWTSDKPEGTFIADEKATKNEKNKE